MDVKLDFKVTLNLTLAAIFALSQVFQPVPFLGGHEHDDLEHELLSLTLLHFGVDAGKELP